MGGGTRNLSRAASGLSDLGPPRRPSLPISRDDEGTYIEMHFYQSRVRAFGTEGRQMCLILEARIISAHITTCMMYMCLSIIWLIICIAPGKSCEVNSY